jgi:hypothetical protein
MFRVIDTQTISSPKTAQNLNLKTLPSVSSIIYRHLQGVSIFKDYTALL